MMLHYFHGDQPNFGDDLNPWLWSRLLPGTFDQDGSSLFVGIGTLLNDSLPRAQRTVVFGSGVGYGHGLPRVDASWRIYALRGPLSAKALHVPERLAVTDGAMLIGRWAPRNRHALRYRYAFMPHVAHANAVWELICREIGFSYIDPGRPVEEVLAAVGDTEVLLTEAMHGAIVADVLRVPWVPVHTGRGVLAFKWEDWCRSMGVAYQPHHLPSSLMPVWPYRPHSGIIAPVRHWVKTRLVAAALRRMAGSAHPSLSDAACLARRVEQLEQALGQFRRDLAVGAFAGSGGDASRAEERHD